METRLEEIRIPEERVIRWLKYIVGDIERVREASYRAGGNCVKIRKRVCSLSLTAARIGIAVRRCAKVGARPALAHSRILESCYRLFQPQRRAPLVAVQLLGGPTCLLCDCVAGVPESGDDGLSPHLAVESRLDC